MEPKAGSFCWLELGTTNREAGKNFYSSLFGWSGEDVPMGPEMAYTLFRSNGNDVAGAYQLMKEQVDAHVPPHWMVYFQTTDVDATAAKAKSLGANLLVPPMDIPNVGRFSVIADPQGAAFAIYKPLRG